MVGDNLGTMAEAMAIAMPNAKATADINAMHYAMVRTMVGINLLAQWFVHWFRPYDGPP